MSVITTLISLAMAQHLHIMVCMIMHYLSCQCYIAPAVVDNAIPLLGRSIGGTVITLYGSGFTSSFQCVDFTSTSVISSSHATCLSPSQPASTSYAITITQNNVDKADTGLRFLYYGTCDRVVMAHTHKI